MSTINKHEEDNSSVAYTGGSGGDSDSDSGGDSDSDSADNRGQKDTLFVSSKTDNKSVGNSASSIVNGGVILSSQSIDKEEDKDKDEALLNLLLGRRSREQEDRDSLQSYNGSDRNNNSIGFDND